MGPFILTSYSLIERSRIAILQANAPKMYAFINKRVVRLWEKGGSLSRFELEDLYDLNETLYEVYGEDDDDLNENKTALTKLLQRPECIDDRPRDLFLHGRPVKRRSQMRILIFQVYSGMMSDMNIMKYSQDYSIKIAPSSVLPYKLIIDDWIQKGYFSKTDIYKRVFSSEKDFAKYETRYKEWKEQVSLHEKLLKSQKLPQKQNKIESPKTQTLSVGSS